MLLDSALEARRRLYHSENKGTSGGKEEGKGGRGGERDGGRRRRTVKGGKVGIGGYGG